MQYSVGSVSMTLNSTLLIPPLTRKRSPFLTGRYASKKYAAHFQKRASNRFPVMPSTVSSIGRMCTRFPYFTSWHWWTETTSPSRTLRFFLTTLFILILGSSQVSSARTMQIVSFLFLPYIEDGVAAEELQPLHGVRVQRDDGVVVIGGLVHHQPVRRLLPLQDRRRVVLLPL
ncbi:Os10g0442532, partial [Oryza sativa Japonica Group]